MRLFPLLTAFAIAFASKPTAIVACPGGGGPVGLRMPPKRDKSSTPVVRPKPSAPEREPVAGAKDATRDTTITPKKDPHSGQADGLVHDGAPKPVATH